MPEPQPAGAPVALKATLIESGLDFSIALTAPEGDLQRIFILERGGKIWLRKNGARLSVPFVDLASVTGGGHEHGVFSVAFHPRYAKNQRFFVYYADPQAHSRLVEYRALPSLDRAYNKPIRILFVQEQADYAIHYGGHIAFGPDGYLYVGMGDGQTGGIPSTPAQDPASILGKMLRLDVDHGDPYGIPKDNPFAGKPGARQEIYMLGLRNPWRWSFDRETSDLWIADVGEDLREEIAMLPMARLSGSNWGWPMMEGSLCFRPAEGCNPGGLVLPVLEYDHKQGCSITGGYVYRGKAIPKLRGTYFYGDYCSSWIRSFRLGPDGKPIEQVEWTNFPKEDNPVSFGEDAAGEIYIVMASGKIYRIDPE